MIKGRDIAIRKIRDEAECRKLYEVYNDLAERALTDHDETFVIAPKLAAFREHGMWTPEKGLMLVVDHTDTMVGMISFLRTTTLECDVGYRILRTEDRRRGMMTEAVMLLSTYLFARFPKITRLQIRTAHDNEPSIRLAKRCGFTREGVLRRAYSYRGHVCDCVVFSLLREECHPKGQETQIV
jgi:RimJ/RimL family protein N-acetyltransferase